MSSEDRQLSPDAVTNIVRRCQAGEREAFRELYDAFQRQVFTMALYSLNGDRATAEDVTQNVFVRLFSVIGSFRHQSSFKTWLFSLAANACTDEHRRRKRFLPWSDVKESTAPGIDDEGLALRQCVHEVLATLQPDFRITVLLKYFEDLSYEEIAHVLGCEPGTVASRLNRSHKILAQKLASLAPEVRE